MSAFERDGKPEPKLSIGFVGRSVLPGENQEEFDRLQDDIYEQYDPVGPVEEDLVETIVNAIWRKRHMDIFHRAFKARMIWGSFFSYPGDPDGDSKITQAHVEQASASMVKEITKFATTIVKRKLDEDAELCGKFGDEAEKIAVSTAAPAPQEDFDRKAEAAVFVGSEDVTKTILGAVANKALAEVKKMYWPRASRGATTSNIESIIEGVVKKELKEIPSQKDAPPTVAGRMEKMWHNMMTVMESTLGADVVAEIFQKMVENITEQALAEFGDLLTPEHALEEMRFSESMALCIERAHDRLIKMQDRRAKKAAVNVITLQPGWVARKR
jgi:hypothetical protein